MVYNPFNVLLWFARILFGIFMLILVKDICDVLVVSLPGFGISVKVFKIHSGFKKKKERERQHGLLYLPKYSDYAHT